MFGKFGYVVDGFIDLSLPLRRLGHDLRDRPAMARDDDRLPPFDIAEQPGKVGFRLGGLNFARHKGAINWSNRLVISLSPTKNPFRSMRV